LSSLSEI